MTATKRDKAFFGKTQILNILYGVLAFASLAAYLMAGTAIAP